MTEQSGFAWPMKLPTLSSLVNIFLAQLEMKCGINEEMCSIAALLRQPLRDNCQAKSLLITGLQGRKRFPYFFISLSFCLSYSSASFCLFLFLSKAFANKLVTVTSSVTQ